ncbi:MAG: nucleotide exchange factor GrpE [Lachnospiraceae bacterium]|nr:nucleotide exchange factor GrpE [Lachnospiraceae bacterium]
MAWAEFLEKESGGVPKAEYTANESADNETVYQEDTSSEEPVVEETAQAAEEVIENTEQEVKAEDIKTEEPEEVKEEVKEEKKKPQAEEKKKFKKEKKEKKDKKDTQIEELNDKLVRTMAEFDNFRKRSEKEKAAMFEIGAKSVIEKILPVIDNFERGLDAVSEEEKNNAFVQGVDKIYKQFLSTLSEIGVKPIEAVGKEFNPDYHNAVMHVDDEELGENVVAEEFQKGYTYRDSVVRHSMVKVAN